MLPETAVYDDNHLYVIRNGRMAAVDVTILARQGDQLIIAADIASGERVITSRLSQAGEGVAVTVEGEEPAAGPGGGPVMIGPGGGPGGPPQGGGGMVMRGPGGG
jgi:membrane fusion protein, multidrug efflux system